MAPLIFLLGSFTTLYLVNRFFLDRRLSLSFIGRFAMAVMLTVTGIVHFTSTDWMVAMVPDALPAKRELVYFTGVCELAAAVGLLWERFSKLTSVMLIIFFIAIRPTNIADALKNEPLYLLFRVPEQIFFIWWVWYFGVRSTAASAQVPG
jgi:uncharacterized membrane protein